MFWPDGGWSSGRACGPSRTGHSHALQNGWPRGRYLVTAVNGCLHCHSPHDWTRHEAPIPAGWAGAGQDLVIWKLPGHVVAPNLTPDPSGIPYYDAHLFVETIRNGQVKARMLNQIMPWHVYRNMTVDDLDAIFRYLQTLSPGRHHVDNAQPPMFCSFCKNWHGAGDLNQSSVSEPRWTASRQ